MFASVATFAIEGVESHEIAVEVDLRRGLPAFAVVGLPDAAVREARERVRAALLNSGQEFPMKRLTANLAPAHLRKAGPSFDLALAVAVLAVSGQVPREGLERFAVCGELSLSGALRPVLGTLAMALGARREGFTRLIVPVPNAAEASLVEGLEVLPVPSLERIVDLLRGRWEPDPPLSGFRAPPSSEEGPNLGDVRGQLDARRALEIAAAGGHALLMVGPPGVGKTMLARRLPGILPPPTLEEAIDITRVHSVAGIGDGTLARTRPFRAPHHTISASGLVGGGSTPRPGEITLAHRGVLFLDELAEFSRPALEALRQPLESGVAEVSRGQRSIAFPARATLVGACNACPCGRPRDRCVCTDVDRARYARRLSGPLLDRMDLVCELTAPSPGELSAAHTAAEGSAAVRARVLLARERQHARLAGSTILSNAAMDPRATVRYSQLSAAARSRLAQAGAGAFLSGRGHDRVVRVARTVADLGGRNRVSADDIDEALGFRAGTSNRAAA